MSFYSELRETIEEVDGVTRELATGIVSDLRRTFGRERAWDIDKIDDIQKVVDGHLDIAYGPSRGGTTRGKLYKAIYRRVLFTGNRQYEKFFRELDLAMRKEDPARWRRVRGAIEKSGDPLGGVYMSLGGRIPQAERRRRARMFDPQRRWVSPGGKRLSDRVWDIRIKQRQRINRILRDGIRSGQSPALIATKLDKYLNPDHAAVVYRRNGQIVRKKQGTGGGGASSSRRLARTELSRSNAVATQQATRRLSDRVPGTGLTYSLSPAHPKMDICDFHAANSDPGYPRGTYRVENAPKIPQHPHCLCTYRPYTPSSAEILDYLERTYVSSEV